MQSKVSIVIPAYNEEKCIGDTLKKLPCKEIKNDGYDIEVIVVDNNCSDNTVRIANDLGAKVVTEIKRGYGHALHRGFVEASGDIIVTIDADNTYPSEEIPFLVKYLDSFKLDFITTNRFKYLTNDAMKKKNVIGNKILSHTMDFLFWSDVEDSQSGMWVFRKDILSKLKLHWRTSLSQEIKIEASRYCKKKFKELPIQYYKRLDEPKLGNLKVGVGNLCDLFVKRVVR